LQKIVQNIAHPIFVKSNAKPELYDKVSQNVAFIP
jgi:hypothetical protein